MVTAYSPILKLALPVQGELTGTWGDVVNDNITSMVEQAIAGRAVINTWTANAHTLTTVNGLTSESRCAMLELTDTGAALTGAGTVVCPTASKIYVVKNASGQNITVKTSSGTGVLVPNGRTTFLFCDGTNVLSAMTHTTSLELGTTTVVTAVLDEDNMASNSATSLATQQSIKAYVDSQVGANNELSEVLANGNTTGGTDLAVSAGDNITFADNSKALFGASNDLQIYHDGANSRIYDVGTGELRLQGTNLRLMSATGESYLSAVAEGAVSIYYDDVVKLASTTTGVDVTGTVTADQLTVSSTAPTLAVTSADGNNAILDLGHTSDPDGGRIVYGAANALSLYTESVERLRIDASGKVGIGTASPTTALDIVGVLKATGRFETSDQTLIRGTGASGNNYLDFNTGVAAGNVIFRNGSGFSEDMRITSTGSVGIGTTSPLGKLTVAGTETLGSTTGATAVISRNYTPTGSQGLILSASTNAPESSGTITYADTSAYGANINIGGNAADSFGGNVAITAYGSGANGNNVTFSSRSGVGTTAERMRITSSGNVGIGTSSTGNGRLTVDQGGDGNGIVLANAVRGASYTELSLAGTTNQGYGVSHYDGTDTVTLSSHTRASHEFRINGTERMRINSSGNVGIGTSSPNSLLEISKPNASGIGAELILKNGATGVNTEVALYLEATGTQTDLGFFTADGDTPIERVTVTSSGNVGIGGTPAAWSGVARVLEFDGQATDYIGFNSATSGYIYQNAYYDGTNNFYKNTGLASAYGQAAGVHSWFGAASGTGGTTATFAERMRIDASGNVLVGKTVTTPSTAGVELQTGVGPFGAVVATASVQPLLLNRLTTDGDIAVFRKDNTTVGSIGTDLGSGDFYVQSGITNHAGLGFKVNEVLPRRNGFIDGIDNLGSSAYRFNDLYLSGGVYLGGTDAAHKLDDYEEGTFTPTLANGATGGSYNRQIGNYTKVGNTVFFSLDMFPFGWTANSVHLNIGGLPFLSVGTDGHYGGAFINYQAQFLTSAGTGDTSLHVPANNNLIGVFQSSGNNFPGTSAFSVNRRILITGTYTTP